MFRKALLAVIFTLPLVWASPVAAQNISFDPDGLGGAFGAASINLLDAKPGNVLAIGSGGATGQVPGSPVQSLYQANLTSADNTAGTVFPFGVFGVPNASVVAGIPEVIVSAGPGGIVFDFNSAFATTTPTPQNFFYMYIGATDAEIDLNNLDGICFTCGTRIIQGVFLDDTFFANAFNLNLAGTPTLLDQFDGDSYNGQLSIAGTGSLNAHILITFAHPDYFPGLAPGSVMTWSASTDNVLPFTHVDPSACFSFFGTPTGLAGSCTYPGAGNANVGTPPSGAPGDFGVVNGESTDVILESDGRFSFAVQQQGEIPEPATLTLLGIGLLGSAAARRRQKKGQK